MAGDQAPRPRSLRSGGSGGHDAVVGLDDLLMAAGRGDEAAFAGKTLRVPVTLGGAKWVRLEAWDVAVNGAFTQPVWVE